MISLLITIDEKGDSVNITGRGSSGPRGYTENEEKALHTILNFLRSHGKVVHDIQVDTEPTPKQPKGGAQTIPFDPAMWTHKPRRS